MDILIVTISQVSHVWQIQLHPIPKMKVNTSKEIELNFTDSKSLTAHIYPNPNNGIFTLSIQHPDKDLVSIKLQNLLSETLWSTQTNNTDVFAKFDFLPKGIYFMQIKNEKESITKKIIIN